MVDEHTQPAAAALSAWLSCLEVGSENTCQSMTVFPVLGPCGSSPGLDYMTLSEALAQSAAEVKEQPAATVPELVLANHGWRMLFVLGGEEIVGGLQNRVANASFLVAAGALVTLPVTCVEHGRWHGSTRHFAGGEASPADLRAAMSAQVSESMHACRGPVADQGMVWSELAARHAQAGSRSATGAMHHLFETRQGALSEYERAFPYVQGACGLAVAISGRVAGADVFDQPRTAAALWTKLVRSYALDALGRAPAGSPEHAKVVDFLASAHAAHVQVYPSLALGEDVRLEGSGLIGSALVYQRVPVHTAIFQGPAREPRIQEPDGIARASARRWFHGYRSEHERQQR